MIGNLWESLAQEYQKGLREQCISDVKIDLATTVNIGSKNIEKLPMNGHLTEYYVLFM